MATKKQGAILGLVLIGICIASIIGVIALGMWGLPKYRIYKQNLHGQAELREAEWTKKIAIESAKAKEESAKHFARAEAIRAGGVAKANKIIGDSLKDNDGYLQYLWIDTLGETTNKVIYVPTEGNLPLLEAGKR